MHSFLNKLYNFAEVYEVSSHLQYLIKCFQLQYFEETVIQEQCDPSLNVFENKVKSLNDFFGSACKAGSWSPDPVFDEKLSKLFSNTDYTEIFPV